MKYSLLMLMLIVNVYLQGCKSTPPPTVSSPFPALHDNLFPSYQAFPVESEAQVFALGEEAKLFVSRAIAGPSLEQKNIKGLVKSIFDHSEMGLLYRNNANTVAETTFLNRSANCLSLSIMTYAMAEHAGFDAEFYEVDIPEYWTRRDGFSVLNGHINLRIALPEESSVVYIGSTSADVDFDPQMIRANFPRIAVNKRNVLAMFYNNKGADALIANSYTRAYSYFRAAAVLSPELQQTWVNLGILYRMVDAYDQAEQSYRHALNIDDGNLTAWENLSILYKHKKEIEQAQEIMSMVEQRRRNNPFYHFILGEQALEDGNLEDALVYYQRALRLDNTRHEVLFGLAKLYYEQGDITNAQRYLKRAVQFAPNTQDEHRYMSKLSTIASNH